MLTFRREVHLVLMLAFVALSGCETQLMPTPNIYAQGPYQLFDELPPERGGTTVQFLYVTDRNPIGDEGETLRYGYGRSASLAFGTCAVELGRDLDWSTLLANSTTGKRTTSIPVRVRSVTEVGRLPPTPAPIVRLEDGTLVHDADDLAGRLELARDFQDEVRRELEETSVKQVFIYVHGFKNTFDDAASVLGEFWHFSGRIGVPILYSWPAGSPGLLRGYTYDRESGEFTIFHLKQLIRALAAVPEVERINVIAHSRGTDVVSSALREILIEERGAGRIARDSMRIGHVALAAPDLDVDVVAQRFGAELFSNVCRQLTLYVSEYDKALGLADWLFGSRRRLGQMRIDDVTDVMRANLAAFRNIDIVDCRLRGGGLGHSYFHSNPAVSADLILTMRYGAEPGSDERPLRAVAPHYWVLEDSDYPAVGESK